MPIAYLPDRVRLLQSASDLYFDTSRVEENGEVVALWNQLKGTFHRRLLSRTVRRLARW